MDGDFCLFASLSKNLNVTVRKSYMAIHVDEAVPVGILWRSLSPVVVVGIGVLERLLDVLVGTFGKALCVPASLVGKINIIFAQDCEA